MGRMYSYCHSSWSSETSRPHHSSRHGRLILIHPHYLLETLQSSQLIAELYERYQLAGGRMCVGEPREALPRYDPRPATGARMRQCCGYSTTIRLGQSTGDHQLTCTRLVVSKIEWRLAEGHSCAELRRWGRNVMRRIGVRRETIRETKQGRLVGEVIAEQPTTSSTLKRVVMLRRKRPDRCVREKQASRKCRWGWAAAVEDWLVKAVLVRSLSLGRFGLLRTFAANSIISVSKDREVRQYDMGLCWRKDVLVNQQD